MTATTAAKIDFDDVQYLTKLKDTPKVQPPTGNAS
jgi:hypothetical protein